MSGLKNASETIKRTGKGNMTLPGSRLRLSRRVKTSKSFIDQRSVSNGLTNYLMSNDYINSMDHKIVSFILSGFCYQNILFIVIEKLH